MKANINPDTRENKFNGRRSISILKRQDTCLSSEGADENTEGPRTPRRVSFAKSAMVRYMHHLGDDSSSIICSSSDSSTGSSQSLGHDSMFLPGPVPTPQGRCEGAFTGEISTTSMHQQHVKANNTVLTNMQVNPSHSSLGSESEKNKTILYKSMNMSMANISQISQSVCWQDGHEEMNKRCFTVRQQEAQNRTILFTDMDEYDCCMEMTSTISDTSQHADDNFHPHDFPRKVEYQNKPGLNRRPSFADEGTSDDQVFMEIGSCSHQSAPDCTIIFNNSGEGDMESTQYLTQPVSFPYHSSGLGEGIVFKPKPKLLDDLSSLIKIKEPPHTASFKTQDVTLLGATDMEITEEITHIVSRSALSDITTYKGLAPIAEMSLVSMNASLADQENRLACGVLQAGAHLTKLNKVNTTLEQIYGVHCNSIPPKPDLAFDKAVISPENKENFPIQGSMYNPYVERQATVPADLQASNLQFDASSRCSMVKENNSSGSVKATSSFIKENTVNKSPETDDSTSVIISFPSRAERALDMLKEKSKAVTYVSPVDGEVNIRREVMLQKQDLEGNATILFNNSADIELTETEMTTHTGQMNPNGKNYRHYTMANDNSQIPESSVTLQEPQFYVRGNSQMKMAQDTSRTIYLGNMSIDCSDGDFNASKNISKQYSKYPHNSQMEITHGLSKPIFLEGNGNECLSKVIGKSNIYKTSEDLDTNQMEVTQGLSKTIYLGEKGKEYPSTNNIYKTREDLDTNQMEVTQGLSKTIYLGEKDKECTSRPTNNIYKTSEDLDTNKTQNHARTSFLGGFGGIYPPRNICENNQSFEETYSNQNSSHMEMTHCLSKTLFPGDNDTECHKKFLNESKQVFAGNKYRDTNQEETSGTIYSQSIGNDCQSHTLSESNQCSQESKDFHASHTEHKASEEQYYLKEMNSEFPGQVVHESSQFHGELFKKPYNSQVEMSIEGHSKAFNESSRVGTQQSLVSEMESASSSKSSSPQVENASMLTVKVYQHHIEPVATTTNLQGNASAEVIDQKRALQQALIKEIGFPLSSLSRTSAAFDPFQRRKSCSKDLFFSKGKVWSGKKDQMSNSLVSVKRAMLSVNTPGESTSNYLSSVNCTDPNGTFRAMKNHNDQSTSIYEQIGSSFCVGKFDKPESTEESRLQIRSADSNADFLGSFKVSPSAAVKLSASTPSHADKHCEHLGFSDLLFHQEMPELADDNSDVSAAEDHFEFGDGTILSDIEFLTGKGRKFNLQDVYESLGVFRLERTDAKKVHTQNVASTTLREKLLATVIDVSRLACLKQHVSEIEATISRSKQDSAESLIQFTFKPPEALMALLTDEYVPELRTKTQEMIQSCRISALAKWKQLKTGHLRKFSGQLEAASQTLKIQVGSIISETDKVLDLISNIDQNLQEIEVLCGQKQELSKQQKRLEETERETQQLKTYYMEMNDRVASLTRTNKESAELMLNVEAAKASSDEQISWTSSFVEWTIMRRTDKEIHFGFLFSTLILEVGLIDCGSAHPSISKVSLQSRLGAKSKPWAKLAHSWAVSCIDCYQLQSSYKNYNQMHKLLTNVSSVICEARQLSTELRLVHLKHGLSIDDNRIRVTVSNRKTRQKILLDTTMSWYPHPQSPLVWNVSTIIGSVLPKDVKPSIDRIEGGQKYITRVLSQAVQILSQHKG